MRHRRFWSDAEKLRIITEARTSEQSTSAVARRNGLNANLLFTWLRDPRLLALLDGPTMLPVEMTPDAEASGAEKARPGPVEDAMIEVALPSGARVRFSAGVDMATLENVLVAVRRSA